MVWMTLPTTWPVEDRGAGDRHGPEAGDDPLGHVHRHRDRRSLGGAGDRDQQDPGQHVGEVVGTAAGDAAASPAPIVPPKT